MPTVQLYGPYWEIRLPEAKIQPGDVRVFSVGPWPPFEDGTVSVSATPWDFSAMTSGGRRAMTVHDIEYWMSDRRERYIDVTFKNTGTDSMQAFYFYVSMVLL
jgi:hypothetical protein